MPQPRENLREAPRQDPAAGSGRERQVHLPQADADHPRAGLGPGGPRGVPGHHLQQRYQGCVGRGRPEGGGARGRRAGGGPRLPSRSGSSSAAFLLPAGSGRGVLGGEEPHLRPGRAPCRAGSSARVLLPCEERRRRADSGGLSCALRAAAAGLGASPRRCQPAARCQPCLPIRPVLSLGSVTLWYRLRCVS